MIYALELAVSKNVQKILLKSDSEFLVRQINGEYRVKAKSIIPLFKRCKILLSKIKHYSFVHIDREQNKKADALANIALDEL